MGHRGRDGDPLDALVCVSEPTFPGCVIAVKPIALFVMRDEKGEDDKIVCVPTHDPGWSHAETLDDIPGQLQREITHFFSVYKQLEGKEVQVDGWRSREEALEVIADAQAAADGARRSRDSWLDCLAARAPTGVPDPQRTYGGIHQVQDRGLAAYIAELIGTLFLIFAIGTVVTLFVATGANAQTGSDFAVVGLAQGLALFMLIWLLGAVSGGHFNPAVTLAAAILRRIDPIDAVVYILAQLSGGVLGALLVKAFLLDEGRASHYGAAQVSPTPRQARSRACSSRASGRSCSCSPSAASRSTRAPARSGRRWRSG